jgi:putative secretion ATPase (PEP-CTERM system associated)
MYEIFYRLDSEPFRLSPDHRFCFSHRSYARAKAYMQYAFNRAEGFVMVTGRPGTGKTTLISDLTESLPRSQVSVGTLVTTQLEAEDLLQMVAHAFGLNATMRNKGAVLQYFTIMLRREREKGRRALLIIDEAQNLTGPALEELRLLTNLQQNNQPLLQIFLVGQEELRDLIHLPQMEQVFQRLVAACHIEALNMQETREYVLHRLKQAGWKNNPQLSESLFPIIYRFSEGIPRRINLICGRLLLHGAVERLDRIGVADARQVVSELHSERLTSLSPQADTIFDAPDRFDEVPEVGSGASSGEVAPVTDEDEKAVDAARPARGPHPVMRAGPSEGALSEKTEPEGAVASPELFSEEREQKRRRAERETRIQQHLEAVVPPSHLVEEGGHSWLWWMLLLVLLLSGVVAVWFLGYLG